MTTAIFPGTFDPITNGHTDLIQRASKIFDKVIVAITNNPSKKPMFELSERLALSKTVLKNMKNVSVVCFSGLLVEFATEKNVDVIIRGVRSHGDFEYELQMTQFNKALAPNIETIYLAPSANLSFIASSLVREVASLGGDVSAYIDPIILKALQGKFAR